ncbi:MAG: hypothetical protein DMG90_02490 [Acidobacteria bacterium]|nr:MAG: hypothetical protein DMG90_02490 [Acidobacteriota bacterium]
MLMDEPGCTGCLVECRIIGAICGKQSKDGKSKRNDRLVGVAVPSHTHNNLEEISDLNPALVCEIDHFFVNYHQQYGTTLKIVGRRTPASLRVIFEMSDRPKVSSASALWVAAAMGAIVLPALTAAGAWYFLHTAK